jgi:alpha-amylase/alpha-mannosidase (GH57 family)
MSRDICLCIHGHYYQPPRENPWIEGVERQESAAPFHDWNERIHYECYLPNSRARVIDERGHIIDIVNNFETTSFNIGPTLMSWIREKHRDTFRRIVEADRKSVEQHNGHGNAIAQAYNHIILPLANRRDKVTQIRWGLEDFKHTYDRVSEGIWLPETAVDAETLEVLIEEGVRYIILSPYQAEAVRPLDSHNWKDVSGGTVDPRRPYRYFLPSDRGRFIDIFFYDGAIAQSVAFENTLSDARLFADRIAATYAPGYQGPQLLHTATDGETYGHHKSFGDRVLAYLTHREAPARGWRVVNYGEYLAENPPVWEARLKPGPNGEGTSWSCAHGVGRWKEHCGCRGGGPDEWNQHWRKPLRDSLDWLRDESVRVFEEHGAKYFKDVWAARNAYIQVIFDRKKNQKAFLEQHTTRPLDRREQIAALRLMEMQRNAMLMYTSCGWFFTELSGIETAQILQYAARVLQLAAQVSGVDREEEFLKKLELAQSNVPALGNGRGVYERFARPAVATLRHIVSYFAIGSIFEEQQASRAHMNFYCFDLEVMSRRIERFGTTTLNVGRVKIVSRITGSDGDFMYVVVQAGLYDFRCSVMPFKSEEELMRMEHELFEALQLLPIFELLRKIDGFFGESYFGLKNLLIEDRLKVIRMLTRETLEKVSDVYLKLYDENLWMSQIYRSISLPIPIEFGYVVEYTLNKRIADGIRDLAKHGFSPKKATAVFRLMETADSLNVEIQKKETARLLSKELGKKMREFVQNPNKELIGECLNITKLSKRMGLALDLGRSQEELFLLLKHWSTDPDLVPDDLAEYEAQLTQLLGELQIASTSFKKMLKIIG